MRNLRKPPEATATSLNPKDYPDHRICVAGSRSWKPTLENKLRFHDEICDLLEDIKSYDPQGGVLFVSGAAPDGADRMIIEWCHRWGYPCIEMPAMWNDYREFAERTGKKNPAGMLRNRQMRDVITYLLAFYDGVSRGTKDMIDICSESGQTIQVKTIAVQPTPSDAVICPGRVRIIEKA